MGVILEGCNLHLELETARCRGTEISMVPTWLAPARCIQVLPIRHPLRRLCLKRAPGHQRYEMKVEIIIAAILLVLCDGALAQTARSEEHTSELQSLMRISYAVFCLKKKKNNKIKKN